MLTHDSLLAGRAQWVGRMATVAGTYVSAGFQGDRLWGADADFRVAGRKVTVAYREQIRNRNWQDVSGHALMVDAELVNAPTLGLVARFAQADPSYNPNLSIMNPYWEQYDQSFVPNIGFFPWEWALSDSFMANNLRLYGARLRWTVRDIPVVIAYNHVRDRNGHPRGVLGNVYSIRLNKEIMDNLVVGATYGVQTSGVAGTRSQKVLEGQVDFTF